MPLDTKNNQRRQAVKKTWPVPYRECVAWRKDGEPLKCFCGHTLFIARRDLLPRDFESTWPLQNGSSQVVVHKNRELTEECQKVYSFMQLINKGARM